MSITASSAAPSTCVTKSLARFERTCKALPPSEARLMIEPARRAARTAMLSMGCIGRIRGQGHNYGSGEAQRNCYPDPEFYSLRSLPAPASREHRLRRASHQDHGLSDLRLVAPERYP